jgi:hypothetical protein
MQLVRRPNKTKGSPLSNLNHNNNNAHDTIPPASASFFGVCYVPYRHRLVCIGMVILAYSVLTTVLVLYLDYAGFFRRIPMPKATTLPTNHRSSSGVNSSSINNSSYTMTNTSLRSEVNTDVDNYVHTDVYNENDDDEEEELPIVDPRNEEEPMENITKKVAYVVTITGCDPHDGRADRFMSVDGGAVLAYSIHQNSVHGPNGGRYDYDLYAFHHPNASSCARELAKLGYIVQERDTPVAIAEIQNPSLQQHIQKWGCCGEKELIKFEAFTLVEYPIVVLLDVDTLILKPLDRLFDFLLNTSQLPEPEDLMYVDKPAAVGRNTNVTIPSHLDMLFTVDYATVDADRDIKPVQGGFNILRPNVTVRNEIVKIVRSGDYRFNDTGWGGRTGPMFWGGRFQI